MNFGIIADGNRRWAREQGVAIKEGHLAGFTAIKDELLPVLRDDKDFSALTVYGFSTENWKRSPLEVKNLMDLYLKLLTEWESDLVAQKIKLVHVGRTDRLPQKLLAQLSCITEETASGSVFTIYLCLDYGGRDEIVRTLNKISDQGEKLSEKMLTKKLEVPELDIVLRTGGEKRLSNFCIWQAAYAEFFFMDKQLPAMKQSDIEALITDFKYRQRRKGA